MAQTVVLAYGVNDLDRQRFFGRNGPTDRELFGEKQGPKSLAFARALNAFALSGLFARAWEESDIYRRCGLSENPRLRVPIEEFGPELNSFVERIRADGSTPILLNTAFFNRRPVAAGDAERSDSLYRESAAALRARKMRRFAPPFLCGEAVRAGPAGARREAPQRGGAGSIGRHEGEAGRSNLAGERREPQNKLCRCRASVRGGEPTNRRNFGPADRKRAEMKGAFP